MDRSVIKDLKASYRSKKDAIEKRLAEFAALWTDASEEELFAELAFCIFTPQSKAKMCDASVKELMRRGLLTGSGFEEVRSCMRGVRFPNNKARYFLAARESLTEGGRIAIRQHISPGNVRLSRDWIVANIKGLGYKEASHFLRNIGLGSDLAILDVHILRNMNAFGLIDSPDPPFTAKRYFHAEKKLSEFCRDISIPMAHMDILLWSKETGEIFK